MKVRETIGTTVRTMLNMEVTTDRGPASGHGECDYRSVGEMRTATSLRGRGVRDRVATTCVVMVFVLKSEGET